MRICLFCILLVAAPLCAAQPKPVPDPETQLVHVQYYAIRSLYTALSLGASVYECKVADIATVPVSNTSFQIGKVALSVQRSLFGENRKELILGCKFLKDDRRPHASDDYVPIWPDLNNLPGNCRLYVVVVSKTYDGTAPIPPGVDYAASHVFVGSGPSDKEFYWLRHIIDLQTLIDGRDKEKSFSALSEALIDPDQRVRAYAGEAITSEFLESEPIKVIDALMAVPPFLASHNIKTGKAESLGIVACIAGYAHDKSKPKVERIAFIETAHNMIDLPDAELRVQSLIGLSASLSKVSFTVSNAGQTMTFTRGPGFVPISIVPAEVFSGKELARAKVELAKMANTPDTADAARIVLKWIGGWQG